MQSKIQPHSTHAPSSPPHPNNHCMIHHFRPIQFQSLHCTKANPLSSLHLSLIPSSKSLPSPQNPSISPPPSRSRQKKFAAPNLSVSTLLRLKIYGLGISENRQREYDVKCRAGRTLFEAASVKNKVWKMRWVGKISFPELPEEFPDLQSLWMWPGFPHL